ncbi:ribosomal protein S18-alanine N-acetyltransferase [Paenibacillus yanchengensis]|uniref:Ribosomal protein S18-alanine N-acetyltransferase n=1 Tax=Paenibacillus yanchengensis TaxID=2035833 RepID=A0ABW4YGN6_9BACL
MVSPDNKDHHERAYQLADDIVFRPMIVTDIPTVIAIEQDSFGEPWSAQSFVQELTENMLAKYIVVEFEQQVIGYGGLWLIVDEAHVTNIAIHHDYRKQGLGTLLLRKLQHTAMYFGAKQMTLEVRVSNEVAQHLYEQHGFIAAGVRPGYYTDNNEDALIMWAELQP